MSDFDVFTCELEGARLIEASAGTGKTWNICGLYLRLLLERPLEVSQILVVTFTNAATAELRERTRARVAETLAYLRAGDDAPPPDDPFVPRLVASVQGRSGASRESLALKLDQGLQHFDEAMILTIHGFCQRALADASFSAGLPLALELVTDETERTLAAVRDFWRRRIANASCPSALAMYLQARKDTPEKFAALLARSLAKPLARHLWPSALDVAPATVSATEVADAFEHARSLWNAERATICDTIQSSLSALNARSYTPESVAQAAHDWDAWFQEGAPFPRPAKSEKLDLLSAGTLAARTKRNQVTPAHPFFDAAQALLDSFSSTSAALDLDRLRLIRDLIDTVGPEVRRHKREQRVITFDDMLYNLYAALEQGQFPGLAASLRTKYPVALIDEFQDTDPLQFAIFSRLYLQGNAPTFLVGDPKQAIYSFRHADLHAYLRARHDVAKVQTLSKNQRSTASMLKALNGLFAATREAFMLPGLDYHDVSLGAKPRKPFSDATQVTADLQVWMLPEGNGGPIPKRTAKALAVQATAAEVARLIAEAEDGRITVDGRPLRPGEIALLVRTHAQGSELKQALATLNVGSVELSQASVFQTPDAEEVERVLIAIQQPSRGTLLRGALATEMMGGDAARIAEISGDESVLMDYLERFAAYRDLWRRQGVGVMYRKFLTDENVAARMLARPDGERRLTNLLHLGELIHQAAMTHTSPDALLRWLATQRRDDTTDEVAQLRLESDRNLVQIVTIHKAKGLEFPIVFCPFLWDGNMRFGGPKPEGREYHDTDGTAVIDFRLEDELPGGKDGINGVIRMEEAAEALRLLYVALTRAVYRCYVIAGTYTTNAFGRPSAAESTKSLLNWLVAGGTDSPPSWFQGKRAPADIAAAWHALAGRLAPNLGLVRLPDTLGIPVARGGPPPDSLSALPPPPSIPPAWRLGSFSGLAREVAHERAANDHDAAIVETARPLGPPPAEVPSNDILRFPRGTSAGDCLHAIFERIDFTDRSGWPEAIVRGLAAYPQRLPGVPRAEESVRLRDMVAAMLADVLTTPLADGIRLDTVPKTRRLTELEFHLPLPRLTAQAMNDTLAHLGYNVPRLAFNALEGYLRGFIDLVFEHDGRFYVLDWKSNHLGYSAADYGPDALSAAMVEHSYHLQYLLYTLAVDRYLRYRLSHYRYETHFGGVLYAFVRGIRPDWANPDGTPAGVFHHRPSEATLRALNALFDHDRAKVSA